MVHGPCRSINPNSPCMQDAHCSKKYPKQYMAETQLGANSYPLYRRSSPDNVGQVSTISMRIGGFRVDQQVDNKWIVPYNKLLLRSINCHCNVELCMSIKSTKYVLKMYTKDVIRQCLPYTLARLMKSQTTRMFAMSVAMKQSGGYWNS